MDVILFCLLVFSISSMWLFSPMFEKIKNWWVDNTGILSALGYCQLCCSFWISMMIYPWFYFMDIRDILTYAFISSGVSWTLGALTNFLLYGKALFEKGISEYEGSNK